MRALLIALLCAVALARAPAAFAGVETWSRSGVPGERVTALAVQPTSPPTIYAGTAGGDIHRSTDGGASFALVERIGSPVTQLVADPGDPQVTYAVAWDLYRSGDGSAWTSVGLAPGETKLGLAVDPSDGRRLFATTASALYTSVDGAATWAPVATALPSGATLRRIAIAPTAPAKLYATGHIPGGDTIMRSVDGGTTWTLANGGLGTNGQYDVAVDPGDSETVYSAGAFGARVSRDGGAVWSAGGPTPARSLAVGAGIVGFATDAVALITQDRGAHYAYSFAGTTGATHRFDALAFDPGSAGTVYAGTADGVYAYTFLAPANLTPPSIVGTAQEGRFLYCDGGTWSGVNAMSIEWLRDGTPVSGESLRLVVAADVGRALACRVTAVSPAGSAGPVAAAPVFPTAAPPPPPVTPDPTPAPTAAPPPPPATPDPTPSPAPVASPVAPRPVPAAAPQRLGAPAIRGRAVVGRMLTCSPGRWSGAPVLRFAWTRDAARIRGATAARYRVAARDVRHRIGCFVTAANAAGRAQAGARAVGPVRRR